MPEDELIALDLDRHELECPHCNQPTVHDSPGKIVLFAGARCMRCGQDFVIAMDKPHL